MTDFARARRVMVDNQLRTSGVIDWRVLDAMNRVPRERFVPEARRDLAYIDEAVQLSSARSLLAPATLGLMLQLAEISEEDAVLGVGCGTGYSSAVIGILAARVVGLEDDAALAALAKDTLADMAADNVDIATGALDEGAPSAAPYNVILIEGAVDSVSKALFAQLAEGGRLVAVHGQGNSAIAHLYVKSGKDIAARPAFNASLPPMGVFTRQEGFVF